MALMEAKNITIRFGGLTAVSDFNLTMNSGELVGLIGPNGAGKSTVFNMLCGFYRPTEGSITFDGHDITKMKPHEVSRAGLIRVFQNGRLFKNMSVIENIMVSRYMHHKTNFLDMIVHTPRYMNEEKDAYDKAMELLHRLKLEKYVNEPAEKLPFGIQRQLEVARAVCAGPKMLLLDEPVTGLNVQETDEMVEFVATLRKEFNLTILLIEHTMRVVMSICPQIIVIDHGETIGTGTPDEIRNNKRVIEAYLGVD